MRNYKYLSLGLLVAGCGMPAGGGNDMGGGMGDMAMNGGADLAGCMNPAFTEDVSKCMHAATDYEPREMMPGSNGWAACISDDNTYHPIGNGMPAAVSRSKAFEAMAPKLWANPSAPTSAQFLSARDDYSVMEGLASRVGRRQDVTYPEVPGMDKFACSSMGVPAMYPDRCAGPAKLKPIIDDAFVKGEAGTQPFVQAERIEAALLWFFYLSMPSEVWTCSFDGIEDCDSALGYYTEMSARGMPAGLAKYVNALGPETHNRVYDALLAVRCWRDYTGMSLPADPMFTKFYDLSLAQLQKATLRGIALILRDRIGKIVCSTGDQQLAHIEFTKTLGGLLDHAASGMDAAEGGKLKAYTSNPTTAAADIQAAQASIDKIFGCP